ncbi:MAG: hypothetical protein ABFE07_28645 [Armatimonadia bacterium]
MVDLTGEIVLSRRALAQPSPGIVPGGDCGACCLAGALAITIERAYDLQDKDHRAKDKPEQPYAFGWSAMSWALKNAGWGENDLVEAVFDAVPLWVHAYNSPIMQHGLPGHMMNGTWWEYLCMALRGGHYGFCSICAEGKGPLAPDDHWVLVCGARSRPEPMKEFPGCNRHHQEILVSCSARHPEGKWLEVRDFLTNYGGYNVILVRPKEKRP